MNADDRRRIIERYDRRLQEYGDDIRTLASGTDERRRIRFETLVDVGIASGSHVLDVGCGFGDFYGYLREHSLEVRYTGIDINPALVERAQRKFPSAEFLAAELDDARVPTADFVVSSSAFNLRLTSPDNYTFAEEILRAAYARARRGVAVDFLTSYVDYPSFAEAFHYSPERILTIAKGITKRVTLRHDYPLFEFCVYLYPDFAGWGTPR
jgi:ubiquinone/menaquinone biosynthesis C-methylase UbiE